jgi:hypothetical protein
MITGQSYAIQILGACVALAAFFGLGSRLGSTGWLQKRTIVLGSYSLVSYIGQIAMLQILVRWVGRPDLLSITFLLMFCATLVSMTLAVEVIHWARHKSDGVNSAYKVVFA